MFERLTDKARTSMALANQEARSLNHQFISPDHILLGMLRVGGGVAVLALQDLGLEPGDVLKEVKAKLKSGPDMVTMGKLPQTSSAKKVIEHAILKARELNHNYLGTEHLLLGLLAVNDGDGAAALKRQSVTLELAREAIVRVLNQGGPEVSGAGTISQRFAGWPFTFPQSSSAAPMPWALFGHAVAEAIKGGQSQVNSAHVLLAMLRDERCLASRAIAACGVTLEAVCEQVQKLVSSGETDSG